MSEDLQALLAEVDAQSAAERAIYEVGSTLEARVAVQGALDLADPPSSFQALLGQIAMQSILGLPIPTTIGLAKATLISREEHLLRGIGSAWSVWARNDAARALRLLKDLRRWLKTHEEKDGALAHMALLLWLDAVEKLCLEDKVMAQRLWHRAIDFSSSIGTESHNVILWTFLASFFPKESQAPLLLTSEG